MSARISRKAVFLIIMPYFDALTRAAIIAVGLAKTRAQGQLRTNIATARFMSLVTNNVIAAIIITNGK